MKAKVTGIGGVFFKCADVAATKAWYHKHLGLPVDDYGCTFWTGPTTDKASQQWSPFKEDTAYFNPGDQEFMINYRVDDLVKLIKQLKSAGVQIAGEIEEFDYGKFGWIIDIDGRKIELWEPANEELFEK
ncbi:VOC family protein [Nonlabens mediterrranea]|uniref:VOC family protein n=1 Tax=Nonlabens mediterrranea TaxID=1419947 RepID=A0ABS0A296_9FLAO|nr:VOC family protein [Nonlabens mediterrranea]